MRVVQTLAIINQKGGVGKTTTVANLGAAIAASGHRLCLIDLDPQAHLTLHMGLEPGANQPGIYQVLTGDARLDDATVKLNENLSAVPSVIDLAAAETELVTVVGREQILRDRLSNCERDYDFVMIDCPPSLGLLTLNALSASDYVFIPLQAHFLALQGLGMLLETISLVQQRINPALKVGGVILCMYERQTRLAGEVVADLEGFLQAARGSDVPWADACIFSAAIRRNIKLAECPSYGKTIFDYDPNSHGALDYGALAEEFLAFFSPQPADSESTTQEQADEPAEEIETTQDVEPPPPPDQPVGEPASVPDAVESVEAVGAQETVESDEAIPAPQAVEPDEVAPVPETPPTIDESPGEFRTAVEATRPPHDGHPYGAAP